MRLFKWFNVWLSYPMTTCVAFMCGSKYRLYAHVLRVGPLAFCVLWKKPEDAVERRIKEQMEQGGMACRDQ